MVDAPSPRLTGARPRALDERRRRPAWRPPEATAAEESSSAPSPRGETRPLAIDTSTKLMRPMKATEPSTIVATWRSVRRSKLPSLKPILGSATLLPHFRDHLMLKLMSTGLPCRLTATVRWSAVRSLV